MKKLEGRTAVVDLRGVGVAETKTESSLDTNQSNIRTWSVRHCRRKRLTLIEFELMRIIGKRAFASLLLNSKYSSTAITKQEERQLYY